jgi:hypothetical protein
MRICLDLTVFIQDELVHRSGRAASAASRVIDAVKQRQWRGLPLQLVVSVQMLDTLRHVLVSHRGADPHAADLYIEAIADLVRIGPERLDPHLLLAGRERFAIRDREDQGVFAVAIAAQVDLLVTSNLRHFLQRGCEAIETRVVRGLGGPRQLHVQVHRRSDGDDLIVADPMDVIEWLDDDLEIDAAKIRSRYAGNKRFKP